MMEETRGSMDIRQHQGMWRAFVTLVKWGIGLSVLSLVLMAIFLL
jgi:hypothetical protein